MNSPASGPPAPLTETPRQRIIILGCGCDGGTCNCGHRLNDRRWRDGEFFFSRFESPGGLDMTNDASQDLLTSEHYDDDDVGMFPHNSN